MAKLKFCINFSGIKPLISKVQGAKLFFSVTNKISIKFSNIWSKVGTYPSGARTFETPHSSVGCWLYLLTLN